MQIFVTGASGFAGSHFVEYLNNKEQNIFIKCLLRTKSQKNFLLKQKANLYYGDLKHKQLLISGLKNCETVIHFAASLNNQDRNIFKINVQGTENLLKAAVKNKVKKFIYISSADVYGLSPKVPLRENSTLNPKSPYAKSKVEGEKLVLNYAEKFPLKVIIFRPGAIYGERNNKFALSNLIFEFSRRGYFFRFKNKNPLKEFCYAKNLAEAIWLAILSKSLNKEILLISDRTSYFLDKIAQEIAKQSQQKLKTIFVPQEFYFWGKTLEKAIPSKFFNPEFFLKLVSDFYFDLTQIKRKLNYKAPFNLVQGIKNTLQYLAQ